MTFKNKLISGFITLGIASGTTVVGLNQMCVFDEEVLKIQEEKVCFNKVADYEVYKNDRIALYKQDLPAFLWTSDGLEFLAVVNHEIEKRGNVNLGAINKQSDVISEILKTIQ